MPGSKSQIHIPLRLLDCLGLAAPVPGPLDLLAGGSLAAMEREDLEMEALDPGLEAAEPVGPEFKRTEAAAFWEVSMPEWKRRRSRDLYNPSSTGR